jgi:hypothetical protein
LLTLNGKAVKALIMATLLLFTAAAGHAQTKSVVSIEAVADSTAIAELYDRIPVGFILHYNNGLERRTEGYLDGDYHWSRIRVASNNGVLADGFFAFDRARLVQQNYQVQLAVNLPDAAQPINVTITLPHLESIRFNPYTDSLRPGAHFYLNVEGTFSSGKVYPLDTSALRFEITGGSLVGQDLLLNNSDSTVNEVTVTAIYKDDSAIQTITSIPVKQMPAVLPALALDKAKAEEPITSNP